MTGDGADAGRWEVRQKSGQGSSRWGYAVAWGALLVVALVLVILVQEVQAAVAAILCLVALLASINFSMEYLIIDGERIEVHRPLAGRSLSVASALRILSNGQGDVVIYGRGRWSGYNLRLYRFKEGDTVLAHVQREAADAGVEIEVGPVE